MSTHDVKIRQMKFKATQQACNKSKMCPKISKHVTNSDKLITTTGKPLVLYPRK